MQENENWIDIAEYEGLYQVSNTGKVRALNYRQKKNYTKELKYNLNKHGYRQVHLSKNGTKKCFTIHKLVAKTFIPNPNNLSVINHIDGNKLNNNASNLEWCTVQYNSQHAVNHGLIKTLGDSIRAVPVVCLNTKEIFDSIKTAAIHYNINEHDISTCCSMNKNKSAGMTNDGELLIWRYKKDYDLMTEQEIFEILYETDRRIICISTGEIYESSLKAEQSTGCDHSHIIKCCKGKQKATKGLEWKYYKDYIKNN